MADHLSGERRVFTGLDYVDFYIPAHNLCVMIDDHQRFYGATNHRLVDFNDTLMELANFNLVRLALNEFILPDKTIDTVALIIAVI